MPLIKERDDNENDVEEPDENRSAYLPAGETDAVNEDIIRVMPDE